MKHVDLSSADIDGMMESNDNTDNGKDKYIPTKSGVDCECGNGQLFEFRASGNGSAVDHINAFNKENNGTLEFDAFVCEKCTKNTGIVGAIYHCIHAFHGGKEDSYDLCEKCWMQRHKEQHKDTNKFHIRSIS